MHPVWIQEGLSWEQDQETSSRDGQPEAFCNFAKGGDFAKFCGVLIKRGPKIGLSEGEGESSTLELGKQKMGLFKPTIG